LTTFRLPARPDYPSPVYSQVLVPATVVTVTKSHSVYPVQSRIYTLRNTDTFGFFTSQETPNLTIDENGKVAEAKVKAVTMRKSLVGGSSSLGSLEPAAVVGGIGLVGIVYLLATNGIELPF
jgi:hypothetical protein